MNALCNASLASLRPTVVLDSNVVLDLWYFADPRVAVLRQAVEDGQLRWVTTAALQEELSHVLLLGKISVSEKVCANKEGALRAFSAWSHLHGAPPEATGHRLRCTDTDDQKFIDLALSMAPAWLLSRDKAVLKLGKRAAGLGVRIATPEQWLAAATAAAGKPSAA
jgi:uncharacterized protein